MEIQNHFSSFPLTCSLQHTFIGRQGERFEKSEPVLCEHSMHVIVNNTLEMDFVCLPQFLPELILGHLVTEGYIHRADEVKSLYISSDGSSAAVTLKELNTPEPMPDVILLQTALPRACRYTNRPVPPTAAFLPGKTSCFFSAKISDGTTPSIRLSVMP